MTTSEDMRGVNDESSSGHRITVVFPRDMDQTWLAQPMKVLRAKHGDQLKQIPRSTLNRHHGHIVVLERRDPGVSAGCAHEQPSGHHLLDDSGNTERIRWFGKRLLYLQVPEKVADREGLRISRVRRLLANDRTVGCELPEAEEIASQQD